uniref:Uncharacterized protein n=1 Tax=Strongyloides stercoralis TaxID=6248 RepID=A0AAF5DEC7_STRER
MSIIIKVFLLIAELSFLFIIADNKNDQKYNKKIIYDEVFRPHTKSTPLTPWYEFYQFQLILFGCQFFLFIVITIIGWDHIKNFCFGSDDLNSTKIKELSKK